MTHLIISLAIALMVVACGGNDDVAPVATASPPSGQATGVSGVALVGPACPVVRQGEPCPDRPWQGTVMAQLPTGVEVTRTETDAAGRFVLTLAPGDYVILTLTTGVLPAPARMNVRVVAGQLTQIELLLDSGIR